jgi:hypothetical protein
MKRESYLLIPALDAAGRSLNSSIEWDAFLTEIERGLAEAHGCSSGNSSSSSSSSSSSNSESVACLGSGIGSLDRRLTDKALVALALIQYVFLPCDVASMMPEKILIVAL